MKWSFSFSNLLGTVYRKGNLVFSPDGNSVLSPVGNKISIYDLKNNKSETLPIESRFNFTTLALSPNGITLIAVNEDGEVSLISLISRSVLHTLRTNRPIAAVSFSPDGKHFAFTKENNVFVYKAPGPHTRDYNPFVMERVLQGANDDTTCLQWSSCSRILAVGAKDMTTRLYALEKFANFSVCSLGGSTEPVVGAFFEKDSLMCYTVSRHGHLVVWESSLEPGELEPWTEEHELKKVSKKSKKKKDDDDDSEDDVPEENNVETLDAKEDKKSKMYYKRSARHFLKDQLPEDAKRCDLTAADFHQGTRIMVTGFSNGVFFIHEMPNADLIHSLSISDQEICSITLNGTGDWIAFGCSNLGQLLVWEWQSETYVLKQQGHFNNMACVAYSPDGQYIATGGEDGKVKLWNTSSGFCFVTFTEHVSSITGIQMTRTKGGGQVVVTSSLDGTVRAFDLARYRNFLTFTTPRPVQFSCVAVDASADLVAAGGQDVYDIFLWSMNPSQGLPAGRLMEVISGHEGPVSSLAFSPSLMSSTLVSVSWDKTLRVWDALAAHSSGETVLLGSDGMAVAFRPDGQEVAVATLNGHIAFFDAKTSVQTGTIEGRNDLGSGRSDSDLVTAKKSLQGKSFRSLCYSADGACILAGGESKNICIYHVKERLLVKKFEITQNRSFDAMDDVISRKKMTEFGNLALIEDRDDSAGSQKIKLPGTRKGDASTRSLQPEVRVSSLRFSPTGRDFTATTTEGLLIYSLDNKLFFDPFDLELSITPVGIRETVKRKNHAKALMMAVKLNEDDLVREVMEQIPTGNIELLVSDLPTKYISKLMSFIGSELESTRHIQFYTIWCHSILRKHGAWIKKESNSMMPALNLLHKNLTRKSQELGDLCNHNKYTMRFVLTTAKLKALNTKEQPVEEQEQDEDEEEEEQEHENDSDSSEDAFVSKWSDSE